NARWRVYASGRVSRFPHPPAGRKSFLEPSASWPRNAPPIPPGRSTFGSPPAAKSSGRRLVVSPYSPKLRGAKAGRPDILSIVRLIIATTNAGKVREIRVALAGLPIELDTLQSWPRVQPPDETGSSFAENARQKALYYAAATGAFVVAEDSGLE